MRSYAQFRDVSAKCSDCGWSSQAKNAQGNAARHHDAYGHEVSVEIYQHITYGPKKVKSEEKNQG